MEKHANSAFLDKKAACDLQKIFWYGQSKPRDRSHYERFRPFHQRLYAEVEPTSVTPFSPPAVDRALHGLIVAMVRQLGAQDMESNCPDPFPLNRGELLRDLIEEMIENRVNLVEKKELKEVLKKLEYRLDEWKSWQPTRYGDFSGIQNDPPLMHPAGSTVPAIWGNPCHSWATLSSLRDVDASCEAEISNYFNRINRD